MVSSQIGTHRAPALVMQKEATRVLLEPIGPSAPGADGVVDLYLMPAYDDIASLYHQNGRWNLQSVNSPTPNVSSIAPVAESKALSEAVFQAVLAEMIAGVSV